MPIGREGSPGSRRRNGADGAAGGAMDVSELLSSRGRTLPGHGDRWMLGPTGGRLWMDYLDPVPGFSGRADFIHKMNLPLLFSVRRADRPDGALPGFRAEWRVNESRVSADGDGISFYERKLITWEDRALSFQVWENLTGKSVKLDLVLPEGASVGEPYRFPCSLHGLSPVLLVKCGAPWRKGSLTLRPHEKTGFLIAAAAGLPGEEERMETDLDDMLRRPDPEALTDEKAREYMRWFDGAPDFDCSDPDMVKCWYYRFYLLRKNLSEPGVGRLPGRCFYEGRSHRMPKEPFKTSGWEFSRLIPLSVPPQVTDARWMKDGKAARDALRALAGCLDGNGMFAVTSVDECRKEYAHYAAWALYLYYQVHGGAGFVAEVLPAFKTDARNVYESARLGDSLQVERVHALTGKEYQPSFWYFGKDRFPRAVRPAREGYTPLKRVDRSVYTYLNFLALARLCALCGDGDEKYFASEAVKIRRDILDKMWDPASGCFYDLHYETDEKALVKNIVAVDPLWAGITDESHLAFFDHLLSPRAFALGSAFASAAADCPVFSSDGGWRGDYFKGPHGCMWNGPSWPYANAIALDALAARSKEYGHRYDRAFEKHLREYTRQHFREDDPGQPCLAEFYDSRTGRALSEEADYNHSFYIDLIVRHLGGIEPGEKEVHFHPLRTDLDHFSLRGLRVRGHVIDVFYQREAGSRYADYPEGYTLLADGRELFRGKGAEKIPLTECDE